MAQSTPEATKLLLDEKATLFTSSTLPSQVYPPRISAALLAVITTRTYDVEGDRVGVGGGGNQKQGRFSGKARRWLSEATRMWKERRLPDMRRQLGAGSRTPAM